MKTVIHQNLPTQWSEREKLRDKGQFWTPGWVAEAMVAYVAQNADLIFDPGQEKLKWLKCLVPQNKELFEFLKNDLVGGNYKGLKVYERNLSEALSTGLSRMPRADHDFEYTLADFARVMRGIATGANEFFMSFCRKRVRELSRIIN